MELVRTHLLYNKQVLRSESLLLESSGKTPADAEGFHTVVLSVISHLSSALWQYIIEDSENKGLTMLDAYHHRTVYSSHLKKYMSLFFYILRQRADNLKDRIIKISVPVIKRTAKVCMCPLIRFIDEN